jgi:hypothetical protein
VVNSTTPLFAIPILIMATAAKSSSGIYETRAVWPRSWTAQESEVESYEHQDDTNIHGQPFPEPVSEEQDIYSDYDGYHRHHVKHDGYLSAHFSPWFNRNKGSYELSLWAAQSRARRYRNKTAIISG